MIEIRDLTHRFDGHLAIDAVTFRIDDGEFVVIAGGNGAGKTTLVRHFNGLLSPDSGTVCIDGTPVQADPVAARTSVGMVFQNPLDCFVETTVDADVAFGPENLGLDRQEIDRRVTAALHAVNMEDARDRRIETLSGGEQARVAIAGALAMEPSHLVLDEPFAGLDYDAARHLLNHLETLYDAGTSIIVVTHDPGLLGSLPETIRILDDGRLVANGPYDAHRETLGEYGVRPPG